jgi:hypothetical protein
MDNSVCNFRVLKNPNQRYANTINLVFFRAFPLTKNFSTYVNGLKNWKQMKSKLFPDSQMQIFIDSVIANDAEVWKILESIDARIYLFDCPDYKLDKEFHIGLFGAMVRFYPMFDINTHPLKVAHFQDIDLYGDEYSTLTNIYKASTTKLKHKLSILIQKNKIFEDDVISKYFFDEHFGYPWITAGRFSMFEKIPFKIWEDFLKETDSNKKMKTRYELNKFKIKKEHLNFSYGIDEIFLNYCVLDWLINNNKTIGIIVDFKISYPFYYLKDLIYKNPHSKKMLDYILQKNQSISESLNEIDKFGKHVQNSSDRFYEIIEKYPNWLEKKNTLKILSWFKGYSERTCILVIHNNKVIEIKDID